MTSTLKSTETLCSTPTAVTVIMAIPAAIGSSSTIIVESLIVAPTMSVDDSARYLGSMEAGTSNRSLRAIIAMAPFGDGSQIPFAESAAAVTTAASATACTPSFAVIVGWSTEIGNLTVTAVEVVCVTSRDDAPTTVPVMLIGLVPTPFAVIVTMSLAAEALRMDGSSTTTLPRTTFAVSA